jgi:flap endonuclease-1
MYLTDWNDEKIDPSIANMPIQQNETTYLPMGIRGLTGWIRWAAPAAIRAPNWSSYKNKRVGIDILGFLYKAKANNILPTVYIAHLIAKCRQYNILPIPVFDGKPPDEKRETIRLRTEARLKNDQKRKQLSTDLETATMTHDQRETVEKELGNLAIGSIYVTTEERDEVKRLLYAAGVIFLNANGEADNVLAYLARRGELDAVMTNDMDLLARGVSNLLVPETAGVPGDTKGWISYDLDTIIGEAGLTYQQFLEMCVLMGCDYTSKAKSLPYKVSYFNIKYKGTLHRTLQSIHVKDIAPYDKALEMLHGRHETVDGLMNEKQWLKWSLWLKGSADAISTETHYLDELRAKELKEMDDTEFRTLFQSDSLAAVNPMPPEVRITM